MIKVEIMEAFHCVGYGVAVGVGFHKRSFKKATEAAKRDFTRKLRKLPQSGGTPVLKSTTIHHNGVLVEFLPG